ncbi:hypothetical protein RSal33209_1495 [Renibacterium salmoninarum ATCC 33209]|uniref:Uncharacterized protein n=1 Tax=Renibacterium salmoninarum (strain ATCC 33209 / DSM 20767 / JCM 11484 / NBRC 15589 / NCIMB 2235) TaxID=288705 RepID=A9WNL3_RENSM|nr:hypothetical protein RSal33209_1495 [Renibacterium salmoninarum ATCC 33209]
MQRPSARCTQTGYTTILADRALHTSPAAAAKLLPW